MTRRLAFMGTPTFAVPTLEALVAAGHDVAAVYCQPPRPAGRGHRLQPSPVQQAAERLGLEVRSPRSLRDAAVQADFAALGLDAAVVAAYGLILPPAILAAPHFGCLNVHGSLLPRWRGAAPVERAILAGDTETGITIMQMDAGLDTGPMLLTRAVPIGAGTTATALEAHLSALGATLAVEAVAALESLEPVQQPAAGATYAAKLSGGEGLLDWRQPARVLDAQVRALGSRPGTWFPLGDERIRVLAAEPAPGRPAAPGTVLDDRLTVACGDGALRLDRVQRPGRGALDAADFLRGLPVPAGTVLPTP